jgi:hypothetical protein
MGENNMSRLVLAAVLLAGALSSSAAAQTSATPSPAAAPAEAAAAPVDYSKPDSWLCRPGRKDACAIDLTATVVAADGKLTKEVFKADPKAPIDCFYVYPTVSNDPGGNSDMKAGPEELGVIRAQFARFAAKCRPFAPLYRQVTLTALRNGIAGQPMKVDRALGYNDVLAAWNYYLAHNNKGRGVVLIGHSQGSGVLTNLIKNEIDGKPIQSRLISAILAGTSLPNPKGRDVGGAFQSIPLCRKQGQYDCVITYASFRDTSPPPANSRFGRVQNPAWTSSCTNPAALAGGKGDLDAYMSNASAIVADASVQRPWVNGAGAPIKTPFVKVPGLLSAQCVSDDKGVYLAIHVNADPNDPRTDEIPGDVVANGQVQADWGLHLIDMNLAMGDLVRIVGDQGKAYLAAQK